MLNVNEDTIRAYTEQNVPKKLTITFPNNSNLTPITNANIQEESMSLTGSLCSDSNLMLQGCISTQFNLTTFDYDTDITGQDIIATLSVKDDSYKGEWVKGTNYKSGDIVKFDQEYYMYSDDVSDEKTENIKRTKVSSSYIVYNETDKKYNIFGREPDNFIGIRILTSEKVLDGVSMTIRCWYTGGPYYYVVRDFNNTTDIIMPQYYPVGSSYPLKGWFAEISYSGTDTDAFKEFVSNLKIYELTNACKNELYPDELEECQRVYGYVDTSNTEDIIIFRGKVESFTRQAADPRYSELIAYDKLHDYQEKSIKDWMNKVDEYGMGMVDPYSYQGSYKLKTTYKKDQTVYGTYTDSNNVETKGYYHFKQDYIDSFYQTCNIVKVASGDLITPPTGVAPTIKGPEYVEKLEKYFPNDLQVANLRNNLFSEIGINQKDFYNISLPMDVIDLKIGPFNEDYSALQLLQWICNMNGVCGVIDQTTGEFDYKFVNSEKRTTTADSNYKGEFNSATEYSVGNVVKFTNSYGEESYYEKIVDKSTYPSELLTADVSFNNPQEGVLFQTPDVMGNCYYIEFSFDDKLAEELGVEITVNKYSGQNLKTISLRRSGRVMLHDLDETGKSYYTIQVSNVNGEFLKTFKAVKYLSTGEFDSTWTPESEYFADCWKKKNKLYHPSGMINITELYEQDSIELQDSFYLNNGWKVMDMNGTLLNGENKKNNLTITYSPLYSAHKSSYQLLLDVANNVGKGWIEPKIPFTIKFAPFKAKSLGLPFLELGDYVTFDVDKWSSDADGNPVITRQNVQSIIFNKTMSGINALSDEYEAKND